MILVRKHVTTETAHRLIDYVGKCSRIHGHSYKWEVAVAAPVQLNGISMDFSFLKRILNEQVVLPFDHMLILHRDDPIAPKLTWADDGCVVVPYNPTAENMAKDVGERIAALIGKDPSLKAELVSITVWETENSYAKYIL